MYIPIDNGNQILLSKEAVTGQEETSAQKLSGVLEDILNIYKDTCDDPENDALYNKMQAKADEAKDVILRISDIENDDEDPNADITDGPDENPERTNSILEAFPEILKMNNEDGLVPPFKRSLPYA